MKMNQELLDVLKGFEQLGYQAVYVNPKREIREISPMGLVSDGEVTIELILEGYLGLIETTFSYMPTREHGDGYRLTSELAAEQKNVISPLEASHEWFQEAKNWGLNYCFRHGLKPQQISDLGLESFYDLIDVSQLNLDREAEEGLEL